MMKREAEGEFGYGSAALAMVVEGILPMIAQQVPLCAQLHVGMHRPSLAADLHARSHGFTYSCIRPEDLVVS